jgi:hypothetical protein
MKVNKKAILGMLVAMVMSLGVMGGLQNKQSSNDSNLQQIACVAGYASTKVEGGWKAVAEVERDLAVGYALIWAGAACFGPVGWGAAGAYAL